MTNIIVCTKILSAAKIYENYLLDNALINLKAELTMWRNQWKD